MKTRSCKNKGQRLQKFVVTELREQLNFDVGVTTCFEGVIQANPMGNSGRDVKLSGDAQDKIRYDIECKNCEAWNIPNFWKQTITNTDEGRKPLLVIKKNRHEPLVVMRFSDWKELI